MEKDMETLCAEARRSLSFHMEQAGRFREELDTIEAGIHQLRLVDDDPVPPRPATPEYWALFYSAMAQLRERMRSNG